MTTPISFTPPSPAKIPFKARASRLARVILRSAALLYVLVVIGMYFLQTYLIFPGHMRQGAPDAIVHPRPHEELVPLHTSDGTAIKGLFGQADGAPPMRQRESPSRLPAVLYFYGNAGEMNGALFESDLFRRHGVHCMLVDYPGFGMSQGKPSEQGCYDAAEAAYQYVLSRPDVDPKNLFAAGWSLGSAVAVDLVHRHRNNGTFSGLLTFSAFTSMVDMAKRTYPFLPISLVLKHRFLSEEKLHDITIPYFLAHGQADPAIPYSMSDRLAAAYGGGLATLTRYAHAAAGHNDFFDVAGEELEHAIAAFIQKALKD
jgi:uncharacterized protein